MKLFDSVKSWKLVALSLMVFGLAATSAYSQECPPNCPFIDDDVIVYVSPSTIMKAGAAAAGKCDFSAEAKVIGKAFNEADAKIQEALGAGNSACHTAEYLVSLCRKDSGKSSAVRAILESWGKYVDCVILATDLPEEIKDPKTQSPSWTTLTIVFNTNPSALDPRKFVEGVDVEVVRENDSELIGKLVTRSCVPEVYFGGTKIVDVEKYAVVVGVSQELVEKKIARFQETNEYIVKSLEAGYVSKHVVKRAVFEEIAKAVDGIEIPDDRARVVRDVAKKVKTFKNVTVIGNGALEQIITVETVDAESAQNYADLAAGGLAAIKLAAKNKADVTPQDELGIELLSTITVARDGDNVVKSQVRYSLEWFKKLTTLVLENVKK